MKLVLALLLSVQAFQAPPTRPLATRQIKQSAFLDDDDVRTSAASGAVDGPLGVLHRLDAVDAAA